MYFRWSDSEAQDWAQVIAAYKAAKAGGSSEKGPGQLPAGAVEYIIWIKRAEKAQIPAWACPVCGGTVQADWDGERWTWPAVLHPFCAAGG